MTTHPIPAEARLRGKLLQELGEMDDSSPSAADLDRIEALMHEWIAARRADFGPVKLIPPQRPSEEFTALADEEFEDTQRWIEQLRSDAP